MSSVHDSAPSSALRSRRAARDAHPDAVRLDPICLNDGWLIQSSERVTEDGAALSTPPADTGGWYETDLPATVLGTLVGSGEIADPFFGTNLRRIPGQGPPAQNFSNYPMPDDSPFRVSWWYRKRFRVPTDAAPFLSLRLDGVNYRANVWLNGHRIADARQIVGAYRVHTIDVTRRIDRDAVNVLAIEVLPPRPCDLAITWVDWNPSPQDKNMGLWRDAWLVPSGPVAVRSPHVMTALIDRTRARLTVAGDLENVTDESQNAAIQVDLAGRTVAKTFTLAPREGRRFEITAADCPELELESPRLWWPRFLGEPALYDATVRVVVADRLSDTSRFTFGVREVTRELTSDGHAQFCVNGKPVLVRGAGWASDLFLRREPERELAQLEYARAMNLNTIRFEGMLERNEILDWCDREGMMVLAGWCCCDSWEKWPDWGDEHQPVATESLRSQIRRVRRHPCLIGWLYGSDFPPPPDIEQRYLEVLKEEGWANPAVSSAANKPTALTGKSGMKMDGPYEWVPPNYWFEDTARGGAFGFASEVSPGPAVPPIESLRKMLPPEHLWPIDEVWHFHAGGQEFHNIRAFTAALNARYGEARSAAEFAERSQLMTYEGERALFEAYTRNKGKATGVIHWMLNNAWPSLIWHLFDYYLRPGGGYFGARKACEPLHVLYSYDNRAVVVTNEHARGFRGLQVSVRLFDLQLEERFARTCAVDVPPGGRTQVVVVPELTALTSVYFVDLRLVSATGERISNNFYWLSSRPDVLDVPAASWLHTPVSRFADLRAVCQLPTAQLTARAQKESRDTISVELRNPSRRLAFFVQLRVADSNGEDVLPVRWSDNYVSLLPGDERTLRAVIPVHASRDRPLHVEMSGPNLDGIRPLWIAAAQ